MSTPATTAGSDAAQPAVSDATQPAVSEAAQPAGSEAVQSSGQDAKTAVSDSSLPQSEAEIDKLRKEIDKLDAEILAAIKRRTEISRLIGRTRMASGGPRLVHSREMKVLERFSELGQEGHTLAMLLLRLGRGRLGR